MSRRNLILGWSLAAIAITSFASLGRWQLNRMHQKEAKLAAVQQVLNERRAVPLATAADIARTDTYDWAAGEGHFADAPAVLLDNQQHNGRVGVRAYRLFVPAASDAPLLIELGWLPLPGDRRLPEIVQPHGQMRIAGLLAPPPAHGIATTPAVPQSNSALLTIALDAPTLRIALKQPKLAPRVLKLDPASPLGYARDLSVLPNTLPPERHLGYAVQWFALAAAVLITALILTFRKSRR